MNEAKKIKAELPTLKEIGQAEEIVRRIQECVRRLAGAYHVTAGVEHRGSQPVAEWQLYVYGQGGWRRGRHPLEMVSDIFPDTEEAIARRKGEIERRRAELDTERAELDAEAERLQRPEMEVRG